MARVVPCAREVKMPNNKILLVNVMRASVDEEGNLRSDVEIRTTPVNKSDLGSADREFIDRNLAAYAVKSAGERVSLLEKLVTLPERLFRRVVSHRSRPA